MPKDGNFERRAGREGPKEIGAASQRGWSRRLSINHLFAGGSDSAPNKPAVQPRPFKPDNVVHTHPWNSGLDTGPGTSRRGISAAEHAAHVASIRLAAGEPLGSYDVSRLRASVGGSPPDSFESVLTKVATALVDNDSRARKLDVHNRENMHAAAAEVPQEQLSQLVAVSNYVAGPVDSGQNELPPWTERHFLPARSEEERTLEELTGMRPLPVTVRTWLHEPQWGIHQYQVPTTATVERPSLLGFPRRPIDYPSTRMVDNPLTEYAVNQSHSDEQTYALRAITKDRTTSDVIARGRNIARVEITVPPVTISTYYGQPVDQPYRATAGVTYTVFEDYDARYRIARIDKRRSGSRSGYGDMNRREYYRPTAQEVSVLTNSLLEFDWLAKH